MKILIILTILLSSVTVHASKGGYAAVFKSHLTYATWFEKLANEKTNSKTVCQEVSKDYYSCELIMLDGDVKEYEADYEFLKRHLDAINSTDAKMHGLRELNLTRSMDVRS